MSSLPPEYLDPQTPPDVEVTDRARPRFSEPTMGVAVAPQTAPATHGLMTVGDSLTHGMSSAAVFHTDLSWPAIIARSLDVALPVPSYGGPLGGLPFNIEGLLRGLQDKFGDRVNPLEFIALPVALHRLCDANEDHWDAATAPAHPAPTSATPTSGSTAGTSATACPTPTPSPPPASPPTPSTTTCSGRSPPTTAKSLPAPYSRPSGRPPRKSTQPQHSAPTTGSTPSSSRTAPTTLCAP